MAGSGDRADARLRHRMGQLGIRQRPVTGKAAQIDQRQTAKPGQRLHRLGPGHGGQQRQPRGPGAVNQPSAACAPNSRMMAIISSVVARAKKWSGAI